MDPLPFPSGSPDVQCRSHAYVSEKSPVDAECRKTSCHSVMGEAIEKRTRGSVVRLPRSTQNRRHRRIHDEKVERYSLRQRVEIPCTEDLRSKHPGKPP